MISLPPLGTPEHIRQECEMSLRRLRVDAIYPYQVHVRGPPFGSKNPVAVPGIRSIPGPSLMSTSCRPAGVTDLPSPRKFSSVKRAIT